MFEIKQEMEFLFIIYICSLKIIKITNYKFNKERIKLMYFNSAPRSSIDYKYRQPTSVFQLDDLLYHYPRTSFMPRRRTQYQDRDYLFQSEHLYRERNQLYSQLKEQKLSNQRSRLIIQDLLADTRKKKKYNQDDAIINKIKIKDNSRPNSHDGLHKPDYTFYDQNSNKKAGFTSNDYKPYKFAANLQPKKAIKDEIKNSSSGKKNNGEEMKRWSNQSNHMKQAIFKKLYQDRKKSSNNKQKQSPAVQKESPIVKQKDIYNDHLVLKEEIEFLKQQLQQKNKMIVDLQCELVKKSKVDSILNNLLSKQNKQAMHDYSPDFQRQQCGIQTQPQLEQYKQKASQNGKPVLKIQKNNIDLQIPPIKFLLKQKTLQKSNFLWMSTDKIQEAGTKDDFMETNVTFPSTLQQEKLQDEQTLDNVKNTESKIEPMSLVVHAETQTQKEKPINQKELEETLKFSMQSQYPIIRMDSRDIITESISMRIDSQESEMVDLTLSASQAQPSPQIKKQASASKVMDAIKEMQSLTLSDDHYPKISDGCQTEKKETYNQQSQTSQNVYDHIEQTYLEWVFDKDFKQMERRKKQKMPEVQDESKSQK